MGDRLTDGEQKTESRSYGDIFDELFPQYLLMGMTPEQYWDGEYGLKIAYRKAYKLRKEIEQKEADRNNWYMGQYIIAALSGTPLLVAGLNVKRTTKLPEYPKEPFLYAAEAAEKKETRRKREEDQTMLAMAMFQANIEKMNQNILKRLEQGKKPAGDTGQ